jgi:hypothetical protein
MVYRAGGVGGCCAADWVLPLAKDSRRSSGALLPSGRFRQDLRSSFTPFSTILNVKLPKQ